jgi:transcriptional regulator
VSGTIELLQGTVDVLILRALVIESMHGYAVSRWIRERTDGEFIVENAALYKSLHRLELAGAIVAEWGRSEANRRARYYRLTPRGRKRLQSEVSHWHRYASAMFKVLEPA